MNDIMKGICKGCGLTGKVVVHHKDRNHFNDTPANRISLCQKCHSHAHWQVPGTKPRVEIAPAEYPRISWKEIKKQYNACFPRA